MTDLLEEILLSDEENGTLKYKDIPGYIQALDKLHAKHDKIQKAFGLHFLDELSTAEHNIIAMETLAAFRHGFRLAGRLLLELFSSRP